MEKRGRGGVPEEGRGGAGFGNSLWLDGVQVIEGGVEDKVKEKVCYHRNGL